MRHKHYLDMAGAARRSRLTFKHGLDEGVLVELKQVDDDVVQVVQPSCVLQVLTHLEHAHQLGDVVVGLHGECQLLPLDGRVEAAVDELERRARRVSRDRAPAMWHRASDLRRLRNDQIGKQF